MNKKTILVIDNDDDFNILIKFILEHDTSWEIITASNGEQGIMQAQLQQPDAILLDVVLPHLDGLDIYNLLKFNLLTCSIPVIFVNAMVQMEKIIKLEIAEDIEVISKPFNIMSLAHRVIDVCDRYLVSKN